MRAMKVAIVARLMRALPLALLLLLSGVPRFAALTKNTDVRASSVRLGHQAITVLAAPALEPALQGGSVSKSYGDPGDAYMTLTISGIDFAEGNAEGPSFSGKYAGQAIAFSGKMSVTRAETVSWVTMSASLGDQSVSWPKEGEDSKVTGRTVELPFNFTFTLPPDYAGDGISGGAFLEVCGGVCGTYRVSLWVEVPKPEPSAEPSSEPQVEPTAMATTTPTPEPEEYRLLVSSGEPHTPLAFGIQLQKKDPSNASSDFRPVSDARIKIQALSYGGNEARLADEFVAPACQNCEWRDASGTRLAHLTDAGQPIVVGTDQSGAAQLSLYLDFAKLGNRAPSRDAPVEVPLAFEAWVVDGEGQDRAVAQAQYSVSLDAIGTVLAVTYQEAQMFDKYGKARGPRFGPLDTYWDDPGTQDGPRTLEGAERVLIQRPGEAGIGATGATPGTPLVAGDLLRSGDRVTINACGMVTNLIRDGLPAGAPGVIWVKVRFFDGMKAKVGVNGGVCRSAVVFGQSPESSGWLGSGAKFYYWAANGAVDAIISSYLLPYKIGSQIASGIGSVGRFLAWATGNEAAGWNPVYIKLQSALVVDFDEAGNLHVVSREGEPSIHTANTGEEGVVVYPGQSAQVTSDLWVDVWDTDPGLAAEADELLAELEQDVPEPLVEPSDLASIPIIGSIISSGNLRGPLAAYCGGLGAFVVIGGVLVLGIRLRRRRAPAEVRPQPAATAAQVARCPHCGVVASPGSLFCGSCGGSLRRTAPRTAAAAPTQGRPIYVEIVEGPDLGRRFVLTPHMRLGRNSSNEIPLKDPQASRQHALIEQRSGGYVVSDLDSRNGTLVNGVRIVRPTPINRGDRIRIGQTTIRISN